MLGIARLVPPGSHPTTSRSTMTSPAPRLRLRLRHLATGAAGGLLVALSLPPLGWWPAAWLGLAVVAFALPGLGAVERAWLGAGMGVTQFAIGLYWVQEFTIPGYLVLVLVSSLFVVAALVATPSARRRCVVLGLPSALVLMEWARDRLPLNGFPLGSLALGQASGPLVPSARLGGSLGLIAVTAAAGVAIAELGHLGEAWWQYSGLRRPDAEAARRRADQALRRTAAGAVALAVAVVAVPLAGLWSPGGQAVRGGALKVALIQGGGPRGTRAVDTDPQTVFERHLAASLSVSGPVDLAVWPEGMLQSSGSYEGTADAQAVADEARRLGATVVVGVEPTIAGGRYYNEAVAWGPDGTVVATYRKNHLVPFGEYIPWRSLIQRWFDVREVPLDGLPGHSAGFMDTPAAPLAVMISYEVFFDERARGGVRAGGQLLVVPTNTASYRGSQVPTQELAAAKIRSWETGRWLLQVTPTGYSAVVTPNGAVVRRSSLGARAVLTATVLRRRGSTVYVVVGDGVLALAALVGLAAAWGMARPWRRAGHEGPA